MKVLWFEILPPSRYMDRGDVIGGWQDSLERVVRKIEDVKLTIAFEANPGSEKKTIDGVFYYPFSVYYSGRDSFMNRYTWRISERKISEAALKVVEEVKPDVIHVFGTEWPYAMVASLTNIPVIVHIQGIVKQYDNANYPPGFSHFDLIREAGLNFRKQFSVYLNMLLRKDRLRLEQNIWKNVSFYMGRTEWDNKLSGILHPNRKYYHVDEALRDRFVYNQSVWEPKNDKLRLITTGCTTFWKGPDTLLKTALILKKLGIDFEWNVAGVMHDEVKNITERKIGFSFKEAGVNLIGFINPDQLSIMLSNSSVYVHTAYVENSPNSICEAQVLGVPIVSTNVGGISSLVEHNVDGLLSPANDPWMLASNILSLYEDFNKARFFSQNGKQKALHRHSDENIKRQIYECYKNVIFINKMKQ